MAIRLGMEAVLNYKTGGQDGAGSWVELANVRDVTLSLEAGEADVTTRANSGWRAVVATLKGTNAVASSSSFSRSRAAASSGWSSPPRSKGGSRGGSG